jgi:hypothetical protein
MHVTVNKKKEKTTARSSSKSQRDLDGNEKISTSGLQLIQVMANPGDHFEVTA